MQVSLTATGGLERRLEVAIPASQVDGEVAQRLNKISRTARLKGFRPGKAPLAVIRQQYGDQVHGEVINDLMRASFSEAVAREKLNPAGGPRIEPIAMNPGADLKYAAVFEVLPEVKLHPVSELKIDRPVAEVADADLDAMLDTLRKQRPAFNEVSRVAAANDRVVVDFVGKIDGAEFEGGSGNAVPIVIGANQVMKEFEDALLGAGASDARQFDATFGAEHTNKKLAGKTASFDVKIVKVEEQAPAPLNEDFAKGFGIADGSLESLRSEVRANMARELAEAIRQKVRAQVLEGLYVQNPLELPRQLVEEQIQELQVEMLRRAGVRDAKQLPPREPFEQPARRRVALGLLMSELVRQANLKVSREAVQEKLIELAASYSNPEEVRRAYLQNADMMRQIESQVLETQAIDWVLSQAKVTDKPATFTELTQFGQANS
ncbi:MAG TPA: trigger factor [Steroidobacteraceae bacterium]|jgi:trigger factor|nr:trigger factor [Steroidobacteraceae bacterium]